MISHSSLEVNAGSVNSWSKALKRKHSHMKNPLLGFPEENPNERLDVWIQSTLEKAEDSECKNGSLVLTDFIVVVFELDAMCSNKKRLPAQSKFFEK